MSRKTYLISITTEGEKTTEKVKGLFKDNKRHIFICAVINVALSLILIGPFGIDGVLIGTIIAFITNIMLKTSLISKKILKDVKLISILKYYIISIILFVISSLLLMPIESYFSSTSVGFIMTILKLGLIFILVIGITSVILYLVSKDARNLFKRAINLIKRKVKKNS